MRMAATAAVYNRLHNTSVGVVGGGISSIPSGGGLGHHHQLARSLERILEEAHLSGELILTNRKLKDFPKTGTKYNLNDTVIADLSRNRFCELPEEITTFSFLETLLLYHNTIRFIPESVKSLTSLTYLDLRSNQLSTLPRELCFLPLQVLLVSNNRLTALPDELGRMDRLTDLDASYNQLSTLPSRIGELRSLRSFSLRSNQLMYLPRELTCLTLVSLDVSNNRISSLPLEIRQMSTLIELNIENNPMTSPPASLCVRGLVHVFKYLEIQATKDEKGSRSGGNYDGYTTLRRTSRNNANGTILETYRVARHHVDSGYSTCDGIDKRWSHDMPLKSKNESPKRLTPTTPPLPKSSVLNADLLDASLSSSTSTVVDESISITAAVVKPLNIESQSTSNSRFSPITRKEENNATLLHQNITYSHHNSGSSNGSTPDLDDSMFDSNLQQQQQNDIDKSNKNLGNIQTYREYKEALKQQRSQEVYKLKEQKHLYESNEGSSLQQIDDIEIRLNGNAQSTPLPKSIMKNSANYTNISNSSSSVSNVVNTNFIEETIVTKKPIQKVIPSRNTELMSLVKNTNDASLSTVTTNGDCIGYVKPNSPMKSLSGGIIVSSSNGLTSPGVNITANNNKFITNVTTSMTGGIKSPVGSNSSKIISAKAHRTVTWNHDIPPEKLSFTMRREFDRQREEIELMSQLRNIIETRLKMSLPEDIASALTDGVILCHLANYVRPRSVASIHVPSPGVSKLTMARCRRNVDNFLDACRKIGVDEELICSCADVVPNEDEADEVLLTFDDNVNVGISGSSDNNSKLCWNNNRNEHEFLGVLNKKNRNVLPNPSAVLKTLSALIAMDCNPHHKSIKNLREQQQFQTKLQEIDRKSKLPQHLEHSCSSEKPGLIKRKHYTLLENNKIELEEKTDRKEVDGYNTQQNNNEIYELIEEEQNKLTATCTKEQMVVENENSNYVKFDYDENNLNSGVGNDIIGRCYYFTNGQAENRHMRNDHNYDSSCIDEKNKPIFYTTSATALDVGNLHRHCKLKTFQKIKFNLITQHGNSSGNHCSAFSTLSPSMDSSVLQTIEEIDNDTNTGNSSAATNSGLYKIIDEKYRMKERELSLEGQSLNDSVSTNNSNIKYKLLDLTFLEKACEKSKLTLSSAQEALASSTTSSTSLSPSTNHNTVSKRIEFFEHANIPNGGIIKPKSNIYSIYRVNDNIEDEKLVKNNLICCAADVLEGKGAVQVAITVGELFRLHGNGIQNNSKSPTRATRATLTPSPIV